jgi:hypothetical protein
MQMVVMDDTCTQEELVKVSNSSEKHALHKEAPR